MFPECTHLIQIYFNPNILYRFRYIDSTVFFKIMALFNMYIMSILTYFMCFLELIKQIVYWMTTYVVLLFLFCIF